MSQNGQTTEQLVAKYSATLYRYALALLQNPADAQDAVQETFLRYLKKPPAFADENHEKAWFLTVNANLCRNMLRFRRAHPQAELTETAPAPADTPSHLPDWFLKLPPKVKIVMLLHYVEGYKVEEIAHRLHLTASAVKMRLKKGRTLLEEAKKEDRL